MKNRMRISSGERRRPLLPLLFLSLFLFVSHASFSVPAGVVEFTTEEVSANLGNNLNKKLFSEEGNLKVIKAGKYNDPGPAHALAPIPAFKLFIRFSEEVIPIPGTQASVGSRRIIPLFIRYHSWRSALL